MSAIWRLEGPASGPPIVFVNALGTDTGMWDGVVERLPTCRVLRLDAPGNGLARHEAPASSIAALAARVLRAMDEAGITAATLVGLSLGGVIAQHLALSETRRFTRFVFANTSAKPGTPEAWTARIEQVSREGFGPLADALPPRWFSAPFVASHPAEVTRICDMTRHATLAGYVGCCEALRDADYRAAPWPGGLDVTVIVSPPDVPTPATDGLALAARIPGARTVSLETGHLSASEAPDDFARLIGRVAGAD